MLIFIIFYYTNNYFSDDNFSYYSPCYYMRAWALDTLDASGRWRYVATEPRAKREARSVLCHTIPVSSPVATFEQNENVAIQHLVENIIVDPVTVTVVTYHSRALT